MPHLIEQAKSARATCRVCKQKIAKGELRFGEEAPNLFDPDAGASYFWHHLACAARKKPAQLQEALAAFTGEVPNRAEIDALLQQAPPGFPYAEKASTGRARCAACGVAIEKGALRVAFEREVDTGAFQTRGAGFLHPACARAHLNDPELAGKVRANSRLDAAALEEVVKVL